MEDKDFIFEDELTSEKFESNLKGDFEAGDKVILNNEDYNITEFVKAKEVEDSMGFPSVYSWYKATDTYGDPTNLFFFDGDIDCKEDNPKVAERWFNDYMKSE